MTAPVSINGHARARVDLVKVHPKPAPVETKPSPPAPTPQARWRTTVRLIAAAARSDRTRSAGRVAVRHGLYLAGGLRIVCRRTWEARTSARYERMIRTAEAAGNAELAQEWEERAQRFREQRHRRRMDTLRAPEQLGKSMKHGGAAFAGGMLALGILLAVAQEDAGQVLAPWRFLADLVRMLALVTAVVWGLRLPLIAATVAGVLLALWSVGRAQQTAPTWALPAAERRSEGEPVTPARVVLALRHLGIPALKKAILAMEDGGASMLSPIVLAGCGVEVDVTLPLEVSTEEVQAKRKKLAENLDRHEHELFVTIPPAARTVRLWIADSGALDEPIGPSPLVTDPTIVADYKTGRAPWGVDLRGDTAALSLYQRHLLITGLSNQGKTLSLRALALWLAHDVGVEFRIADLKGIGDWAMFVGIATLLIEGPTDEHVAAATEMVEAGVREMERRLQNPSATYRPLVLIVDEAQLAFMCPAKDEQGRPYGGTKATSRYFMAARKIHNQGRAVDVTLWQGTQDPTDQNLPKLVREGAHVRASLVVGTEAQAKMALGDKAVDGGAAPHKLRQGLDKGQVVAAGDLGGLLAAGQAAINIRTHYIPDEDAEAVADRVRARRTAVDTATATSTEARDELADLVVVLGGDERVRTPEVLHRLKTLDHSYYEDWDGARLKRLMTDHGEGTDTYQGYPVIKRQRVADALVRREEGAPGE